MVSCGWSRRANSAAMTEQVTERLWVLGPVALVAFILTTGLMVLLRPWLARFAMVPPNARSSHHEPTPQGGGIAVVVATLLVVWAGVTLIPHVPWGIERAGLFLVGVWFVNLVNFMDGIDWMTVAEAVPVTGAILVLGLAGVVAPLPALLAAALLGAIIGFAPFNKPVARIFLGDVGSLPVGLLLGWLLLQLAAAGHLAAALLLSLYYLADATITLVQRIARAETIWQAHRTHFYQRATDRGLSVTNVVARVFVVNLVLAGLAFITVAAQNIAVSLAMLGAGGAIVLWVLATFASGKDGRQ